MVKCHFCDGEISYMPFNCKYCGNKFCPEHRLPENHDCSFAMINENGISENQSDRNAPLETDEQIVQDDHRPDYGVDDESEFFPEEENIGVLDVDKYIDFEEELEYYFPDTKSAIDTFIEKLARQANIRLKGRMSISKFKKIFTYLAPQTRENRMSHRFIYVSNKFSVKSLVESSYGNCLAYTTLLFILSKRYGLEMDPAEVLIPHRKINVYEDIGHVCNIDKKGRHWDCVNYNGSNHVQHRHVKVLNEREFMSMILSMEVNRLAKEGDRIRIIQIARTAYDLNPNSDFALNNLGNLYSGQGEFSSAEEIYQTAIDNNPRRIAPWINLANLYRKQGNFDKAEYCCREILKIMPEHLDAHIQLGKLYHENHSYDKAIKTLKTVARIAEKANKQKRKVESLHTLALIHHSMGDIGEALKNLKRGLELSEIIDFHIGSAMIHESIAQICEEEGDNGRALDHYEKALKIYEKRGDPRASTIWNKIKRLSYY